MGKIKELDSLKALLALLVFICHTMGKPGMGSLAVSLFFILSGFGLSAGYLEKAASGSLDLKSFYSRRLWKIVPYHIVFCALATLIRLYKGESVVLWKVLLNALLLQSWSPDISVYYSCNPPSWFLSVLVFCYAVFPFLSRMLLKRRAVFYVFFALYGFGMLSLAHLFAEYSFEYVLFICPLVRLVDFVLGMIIFDLARNGEISLKNIIPDRYSGAVAVSVLFALIIICSFVPWAYSRYSAAYMVSGFVILVLILSASSSGRRIPILSNDVLCALGKYSFLFYICHGVCIDFLKLYLSEASAAHFALSLALSVSVTFVISRIRFLNR